MESLLKAIKLAGGQAQLAALITENAPGRITITPQQIWNWLNRDKRVPAEYCPTIEKIFNGQIKCEELNSKADWPYLRSALAQPEEREDA